MSGRTARRARAERRKGREKTVSYDAKRIYADIMLELMDEAGINQANCTNDEIMQTISACSDVYMETYDEYLCEVLYDGCRAAAETDAMFLETAGIAPILLNM